jgi:hypothetical protein
MIPRLVLVKWEDAHTAETSAGAWVTLDQIREDNVPCIVDTVGWEVTGAKTGYLTLVQSLAGEEAINPFHIPEGMIQSISVLQ